MVFFPISQFYLMDDIGFPCYMCTPYQEKGEKENLVISFAISIWFRFDNFYFSF